MKHFKLTFLLAILMSMIAVNSFAHDFEENGIYYKYREDGTVSVTFRGDYPGSYDNGYTGIIEIPYYVSGGRVTCIGSHAFYNCSGLTSVIIPNSVTLIDWAAFADCI